MELIVLIIVIIVVVGLQNFLYNRFAFSGLDYQCYLSAKEACEGDEIELIEVVSNHKLLPLPWLKAEVTTSKWLEFSELQSVVTDKTRYVSSFFMLKSYRKITRKWKVKCLKRGVFSIDRVVLVTTDLLGSLTLSKAAQVCSTITVYPKAMDVHAEFVFAHRMMGDVTVHRHLISDPFFISGVREYTERDPVNRIHWAATAKEKRMMVYNNEYTASQSLTVILNLQAREFITAGMVEEARIEDAIRVCAWLFENTVTSGMPVRLLANGGTGGRRETIWTNEYWGQEHVQSLIEILARLQLNTSESFLSFLADCSNRISSSNLAIVTAYVSEEILSFARSKQWDGKEVKIYVISSALPELDCRDCEVYCLYEREQGGILHEKQAETA